MARGSTVGVDACMAATCAWVGVAPATCGEAVAAAVAGAWIR